MRSWLWLTLVACGTPSADKVQDTADTAVSTTDPCADFTWETVGAPFVRTWCTPCHSADLKGDARQGAPKEINFNTEAEAVALADEMRVVAAGSLPIMPPAGGPDSEARARFAMWVTCLNDAR